MLVLLFGAKKPKLRYELDRKNGEREWEKEWQNSHICTSVSNLYWTTTAVRSTADHVLIAGLR